MVFSQSTSRDIPEYVRNKTIASIFMTPHDIICNKIADGYPTYVR